MRNIYMPLGIGLAFLAFFALFQRHASLSKNQARILEQKPSRPLIGAESGPKTILDQTTKTPRIMHGSESRFVVFPPAPSQEVTTHAQIAHIKRTLELSRIIKKAKESPATLVPIQEALVSCLTDSSLDAHQQATCMRLLLEIDPKLEDTYKVEMTIEAQELWQQFRALSQPEKVSDSPFPESLRRTEPSGP